MDMHALLETHVVQQPTQNDTPAISPANTSPDLRDCDMHLAQWTGLNDEELEQLIMQECASSSHASTQSGPLEL